MSTPYKKAIDAFIESDDWLVASDPTTIRAPAEMRTYLENRLKTAFAAGWKQCEALAAQGKRQYACAGCGKLISECSCSPMGKEVK